MWKKLFEYKNNIIVENQNLNSLIEPLNINDKMGADDGFIEES